MTTIKSIENTKVALRTIVQIENFLSFSLCRRLFKFFLRPGQIPGTETSFNVSSETVTQQNLFDSISFSVNSISEKIQTLTSTITIQIIPVTIDTQV